MGGLGRGVHVTAGVTEGAADLLPTIPYPPTEPPPLHEPTHHPFGGRGSTAARSPVTCPPTALSPPGAATPGFILIIAVSRVMGGAILQGAGRVRLAGSRPAAASSSVTLPSCSSFLCPRFLRCTSAGFLRAIMSECKCSHVLPRAALARCGGRGSGGTC